MLPSELQAGKVKGELQSARQGRADDRVQVEVAEFVHVVVDHADGAAKRSSAR